MDGMLGYLLIKRIKGQLIKVVGDAKDPIFHKKNAKFKKDKWVSVSIIIL
jgi:hypothetical protein